MAFFDEDEEDSELEANEVDEEEKEPVEFAQDEALNIMGYRVTGLEALKIWAGNALKTPRYRYEPFSFDYGSELDTLIGRVESMDYIESEAERMVEECVTQHPGINGISDFSCEVENDRLAISFRLETDYGGGDMDVEIQ